MLHSHRKFLERSIVPSQEAGSRLQAFDQVYESSFDRRNDPGVLLADVLTHRSLPFPTYSGVVLRNKQHFERIFYTGHFSYETGNVSQVEFYGSICPLMHT